MSLYRKKPIVVQAFRYYIDPRPDWFCDKVSSREIITYETYCDIRTLEGWMRGEVGDWIIQGVKKEIYPCKPDIFEATYEPIPKEKSQPQDTNPHAPNYFPPYDDQGNKRTINNAVDPGWSAID